MAMPAHRLLITRWLLALTLPRRRDERGDVPGWVLVTVMTAGLVAVIWGVAEDQLRDLLRNALNSVR
jgi:hypothetical protein